MAINALNDRTTYRAIDTIATQYNVSVAYIQHMISQLTPEILKQLDLKTMYGQQYLGNLSQRYLLTRIDRSVASMFPDDDAVPMVSTYQQPATNVLPKRTLHVRASASAGNWLLVESTGNDERIIGSYGSADAAEQAMEARL